MTEITIWGRFSFIFSAKGKEKTRTAHKNTSRKPISHTLSNSAIYGYLSLLIRTYLLTYVLSLSAVAASISSLFLAKPVLFCMWVKANSGKGREDSLAATGHDCERERENADLEEWQRKGFTAAHSGRAWLVVVVVAVVKLIHESVGETVFFRGREGMVCLRARAEGKGAERGRGGRMERERGTGIRCLIYEPWSAGILPSGPGPRCCLSALRVWHVCRFWLKPPSPCHHR